MKKLHTTFASIAIVMVIGCGESKVKESEMATDHPTSDPLLTPTNIEKSQVLDSLGSDLKCFTAFVKKDSSFLSIKKDGETVTGFLEYKTGKEKSKGNINGKIVNDTIKVTYNGQSDREIQFVYDRGNIYEIKNNKRAEKDNGYIYSPSNDCW